MAQTEYQDIYRITDGALLVVNKFNYIYPERNVRVCDSGRQKRYGGGTQSYLRVLKDEQKDRHGNIVPKNTVTYIDEPVAATDNRHEWEFQIKTTGDLFSGDATAILYWLDEITKVIEE